MESIENEFVVCIVVFLEYLEYNQISLNQYIFFYIANQGCNQENIYSLNQFYIYIGFQFYFLNIIRFQCCNI